MAGAASVEEVQKDPKPGQGEDDAWSKNKQTFEGKRTSEYYDPCQEFANRSIKCLHRNAGDRSMCTDYFQAYRDCKKEWTAQRQAALKKKWLG